MKHVKNSPRTEERIEGPKSSEKQCTLFKAEKSSTLDLSGLKHALINRLPYIIVRHSRRIHLQPQRLIGSTAYLAKKPTIITRFVSKTLTNEDFSTICEILEGKRNRRAS